MESGGVAVVRLSEEREALAGKPTLIRGGTVITMEPGETDRVADILIEGDAIAAVAPDLPIDEGSATIVDARNHIVVPGFIDTHRHLFQILLRGLGSDWSLTQYLTTYLSKIGLNYTPENAFLANRLGALDAIDSGVTAVFDWCQSALTPEHSDALISGLESTSIRASFGSGCNMAADLLEVLQPPFLSTSAADAGEVRRLRDKYSSENGLITIGMAARGPNLTTMDVAKRDWALARDLGIRLNVHVGQGVMPGGNAVQALHEEGLLGPDLTLGHCNNLSRDEITMLADNGVTITVTPEDECNMGHGWPSIGRLIEGGVWPNVGVDTCLAVGGDVFSAMRFALAIPRAQSNEKALMNGENPWTVPLTARDALRMATIEGARALGQEHRIGTIKPGKQADLVCINAADVSMVPVINPVANVVYSASRSVVSDVFIAGRHVKKAGELVDVDFAQLHADVTAASTDLLARCGIEPGYVPAAPAV
jgi:cytosine/adenosine deaminase-related metal-dependent hydrolase